MIVPSLIAADDRIAGVAEDIDVGVAYQLVDLHIGSVIRSQGDGSVQHEFHISRAAGFLGAREICSEISQAGISFSARVTL